MDKNTILDYATNSPENTNRNVLGSMLDQFAKSEGGGGGSIGVLYALAMEPLTTDAAIPDGVENVSNVAVPVGLTADAETPMDYAALVSYFEMHDLVRVYAGDGMYYVECSRIVSDGPQFSHLYAAIGPYEFFDGDVARFGVMFNWSDK